jgi:hypothetical protein
MKKVFLWIGIVLLSPVLLFIILTALLYLPPVQNWAVDKVASVASEKTGMEISVGHVSVEFPLDLGVEDFRIVQQNDSLPQVKDTIADVGRLVVDVSLLPLFKSKVVVNSLELSRTKLNTAGYVAAARVKGYLERLYLESRGIDWGKQTVDVNTAQLYNARFDVALSDTVPPDTSTEKSKWKIRFDSVVIAKTDIALSMPGDTLRIQAHLGQASARQGFIDLENELYRVGSVEWGGGSVAYDNRFEPRMQGFDYNHIALHDLNAGVDSVYFRSPVMSLNLRRFQVKEKSGLEITRLSGPVYMDSLQLRLPRLLLRTPDSDADAELVMDMNAMDAKAPGKVHLRLMASLGKHDLMRFAGGLPAAFIRRYPNHPLTIRGSVNGNMHRVDITGLDVHLPTAFRATAKGYVANAADMQRLKADVALKAETYDLGFVTALLDHQLAASYRIPSGISVQGRVKADGSRYAANLTAREGNGTVKADGYFNAAAMSYQASVDIDNLNLHHFMPNDSLYNLTAALEAKGRGTDLFSKATWAQATADVKSFRYGSWNLDNMQAKANLKDGVAHANINSRNELLDGVIDVDALMSKQRVEATIGTDLRRADLYHLRLMDHPMWAGMCAHVDVASDLKHYYKVQGLINDLTVQEDTIYHRPADVSLDVMTDRDTTWAKIYSGNLELNLKAKGGYELLIEQGMKLMDEAKAQMKEKVIDQPKLLAMLPTLNLHVLSGSNNPVADFLRAQGIRFKHLSMDMSTSPASGLNGSGRLYSLVADSTRIDTVRFAVSTADSSQIRFDGQVQNNRRNPQFVFNALFDGYVFEKGAGLNVKYYDADNRLGVSVGATAEMRDDGINFRLLPDRPLLGYKEFNLNRDNFIFMGADKKIEAKVDLIADDGTGVKLYSENQDPSMLQDLTVSLNRFDLQKITSVVPYMPRMSGMLSGDFHVVQDRQENISMSSDMSVKALTYEHSPIGNVSTEFIYMQREGDAHWVEAHLKKEESEVGVLIGTYTNKGDGYLDAKLNLNNLPMSLVNGFIPDQLFGLHGYAEGELDIKGSLKKPQVNGEVYLDSSYLASVPYGVTLRFDNDPVRIVGSNLLFENFTVYAHNDNPLNIMGNINFADLDRIYLDMRMRAQNYQLIGARENMKSVAYGKAFVNFFGRINGPLDNLYMQGKLDVLGTTDMSYILRDSPLTTDNQLDELVKFTDLGDTTQPVVNRPPLTGFKMDLTLNISKGAHIMAYLNADHSNYIDLMGGGNLRMQYNVVDNLLLNGRYTLSNGEMKYSLPVIPLKTFTIQDGSYIEFTGDPMNPRLNITAIEDTKATVTNSSGIGRSVGFKCGVIITKTLSDMGLEFTLDAPEDMTIHSELQSMGIDQRGKLAVTMLTTGMYLADGNTNAFSMNSALSSFLNSEINNITGNALRTLDLSFGMDNSTDASGNTHTNYSFKFAKRFWNNRLKISVGGKVSTGDDEQAQQNNSFFDNVGLEYRLDDTANKYVTLFYENNSYDWLDGYTQKYGAGFIWRRTLQNFRDIFNFRSESDRQMPPFAPQDSIKHSKNEK